jgi:hypothetical protein
MGFCPFVFAVLLLSSLVGDGSMMLFFCLIIVGTSDAAPLICIVCMSFFSLVEDPAFKAHGCYEEVGRGSEGSFLPLESVFR